ncbi:TasA family protein, partial [Bacillus mycoides]|uniref:TasA family protein n=1 Tax=Bacillus mycoides TaxID=1405 RepID=UPI003CC7FF05
MAGPTFAYFTHKQLSNNTFPAATLHLTFHPKLLLHINHLKPPHSVNKHFLLNNHPSLPIKHLKLPTNYSLLHPKHDNPPQHFPQHIKLKFLSNSH